MLEAMQEQNVTVVGKVFHLEPPFLRAGDAEPDRAGRDLSVARGPARPVHVLDRAGVSVRGRGNPDRTNDHGRSLARLDHLMTPAEIIKHQSWCVACRCPTTSTPTRPAWRGRPARMARRRPHGSSRSSPGCRSPRGPVLDPGCQGPRGLARQLHGASRGRSGSRCARPLPPDHHHVRRPGRRDRSKKIVRRLVEETDSSA